MYISNCPTGEPRHRAWVYTSKLDTFPPKLAGGGNPQTPTFQKARTQKLQLFESLEPRSSPLSFTLSAEAPLASKSRHPTRAGTQRRPLRVPLAG